MSRHATDMHEEYVPPSPPPLPADHVLQSAAVLFPGAFDQHGCPLIVFPADTQARLSSQLCKAEVVDFINYFLCLHNKQQDKESLVSVVADLRHASLPTTRVIAETLLLLEQHKRTVHCVYFIQPKKKDAVKLLLKLLAPSKSYAASFRKVLLKEISDLSNYIDRSQLTASLGGYLVYCHHSWVAFIKEIDEFVQEFLSVVQRLPPCISTLQALSRLPLPSTFSELQHFCSTNEATFQHLRRELGLDDLLRRCEAVLEKLRYPEREPCYQAMVGTALFTHTAFDMLQNHSRITAAVEKVELLWQQAFSKARLQLQLFQLREDALQITEQIKTLLQERLQPYKIEVAKDAAKAVMLVSEFEASIHTPAMALIRGAEDVIQAVAELLLFDGPTRERWVLDVARLKEKLHSAVNFILQTLRAVSSFHRYYNKANSWYGRVLCENVLQALLSGVHGDGVPTQRQAGSWGTIPAWRYKVSTFLKKNPPPDTQELVHLAHLSNAIPEDEVQAAGRRMSQRCTILRKLLVCSGAVAVGPLQLALQWQYELLRSSHVTRSSADAVTGVHDLATCETAKEAALHLGASPTVVSGTVSAEGKPPSLSSFDSGVDGVGSSQLEASGGREGVEGLSRLAGTRDCARPTVSRPQIHKENVSDLEDYREEFDVGSVGNSSRASIQIIPNVTVDSLNLEIKVKRSAALPNNPWLSLPVDDLENSYTVTITQNPAPQKRDPQSHDRPGGTEAATSSTQSRDWMLHSQSSLEDPDLSPIRNILSSTITDGRSVCTTEGIPTLLWDSYDLHHQNQDAVDGVIDISLSDWDVKEQEELKEVEKILDRADEILEKEENALAQEAVLDALLRSEGRHRHEWPPWDSEDQLMSCSELAEAGVLGLEDPFDPAESDHLVGSTRETSGAAEGAFPSGPDLLTEIRRVHDLDDLIMEEKLKIHELRRCGENPKEELPVGKKPADRNGPSSMSKEREAFRFRLEKEKKEVEILERSVDKERKEKDGARRVVKCSIMEKARRETREDQALCDELLSSHRSPRRRSTSDDSQDDSQDDTCDSANLGNPDVADEATPHDSVQPPDSQCRDDSSAAEQSVLRRTSSDLEEAPEEVGIEPPRRIHANVDSSSCDMPHDGALDPGETSNLPPEPGNASLPVNEPPPSTELQDPARSSGAPDPGFLQLDEALDETPAIAHDLVVHLNAMERSCNNNNNNCVLTEKCEASLENLETEISTKGDEDPLLQTDQHPEQEVQTLSAADERRAPQPPLEFDPGGRDGVRTPEAVRISCSGSPGIPAQLINMTGIADFKTPIVMDTGSGLMKAGFADQDLPKVIFPTIIGMPKYEEIMNGDLERETYIGHAAQHMRGVLALKHPIKNGIIRNWDEMEKIWHHTFQQLCVDPEDHPVLLTEAAMNPLDHRQRAVEIMFESFNVPFTYVAMQAVLALYAAGRTTGVVFDSGDGVSHSVPVFEGYCLPHAVQRLPLAGGDVTMHLQKLLQEQGVCMRTTAEVEIVREMKERCCCVALDYEAELSAGGASCREMHYTMPDGQIVTLDTERFRAPEILFKPELIGRDHHGMHESVFRSILSSDIDLRRSFLGNIVLSGGNTLLPGLPERLQAEVRGLLPADMPPDSVRVAGAEGRDFAVWRGGAVLADLHVHPAAWISREEYEEYGPQIVFRKCF